MKLDKTFQFTTQHGIVFNVSQITLTDSDRGRLRELHFGEAKNAHYQINSKVVEVYDKMQAKNLPCTMTIGISQPLTRHQGDALTGQRTDIVRLVSAASGGAAGTVGGLAGPWAVWPPPPLQRRECAHTPMVFCPPSMLATSSSASRQKSTVGLAHSALPNHWSSRSEGSCRCRTLLKQ